MLSSRSLLLALVLLAPVAAADAVRLESALPVEADGALVAVAPGGVARLSATGSGHLLVREGTALLQTYERVRTGDVDQPLTAPVAREYTLAPGRVELDFGQDAATLWVAAPGGTIEAASLVSGSFVPAWIATPWGQDTALDPRTPRSIDMAWDAGWPYVGHGMPDVALTALATERATIGASGTIHLEVRGGTVSFRDAEGATQEVALGWQDVVEDPLGLGVRRGTYRSLILEVEMEQMHAATVAPWGLAAPTMEWRFDGGWGWERASGEVEHDGATTRFADEPVRLRGEGTMTLARGADGFLYEGAGEWRSVRVAGAPVAPASPTVAGAAAAAGAGVVLVAAGWYAYTRLTREAAATHPTRSAILAIVRAEPGIHLREIHRRVGGAWGPFMFHIRMLERMKLVELARDGRYLAARLPGERAAASAPRSEVQRRILAELGARGALPKDELCAALGISRQLLRYHVGKLARAGLVVDEAGRVAPQGGTPPTRRP